MSQTNLPEVWLRGPFPNIPALLQPVAHALLQAREEVNELVKNFPAELLWEKPAGVASVGFHLQHMPGVLDRLFTYAKGQQLSDEQLKYLSAEGKKPEAEITITALVERFNDQVEKTIDQLKTMDESTLTEPRTVGRKQLPSTVLGLIFHSAEHTMRHLGQLLVTVRVLKQQ
ncbi:MAG: DinB family protein [Segetibacter sp.]|nr:DinB family protein [Segetibacter sp.]